MSLYTRSGDSGFSSTATRRMIPKDSPVFSLLGTLEELNAALGMARGRIPPETGRIVRAVQQDVLAFSSRLSGGTPFPAREKVAEMEKSIDIIRKSCPGDGERPLPGDCGPAAALRMAWAVARRAERQMVACKRTGGISRDALMWGNRLSDFIDSLARLAEKERAPAQAVSLPQGDPPEAPAGGEESFCEMALWLCREVLKKAAQLPVAVAAAVCDAGGNAAALLRADGAQLVGAKMASDKAYTSLAMKMPTEKLAGLAAPGGALYGVQSAGGGRIVVFGGGVPLYLHGRLIGGFGVSGGTCGQDTELARYAEQVFRGKYH